MALQDITYPAALVELRSLLTPALNVEQDLWVFEDFNAVYKPSGWTRNPESDAHMLTFAKDGVGGQVLIWLRAAGPLLRQPVAFLGRDGEVAVIAADLSGFGVLLASGISPYSIASGEIPESPKGNPVVIRWMKKHFGSAKGEVGGILKRAQKLGPEFGKFVRSQKKPRGRS